MPGNEREIYNRVINKMNALERDLGIKLYIRTDFIESEEDGYKAKKFIEESHVDLFLLFTPSLPYGRAILPVCQLDIPIGFWAVPEPQKQGILQLNSFCGVNFAGSILSNYLYERSKPFKWFYGIPDNDSFLERFRLTIKAMRTIKILKQARIGQIGDLADGFENMYADERVLVRKFGTYIQTRHTVEDIIQRAESYKQKVVEEYLTKEIEDEAGPGGIVASRTDMIKFARINIAFRDFALENDYHALAINCWPKFQQLYNITVCSAMSRLNNNGIVAVCEADLGSTLNMLILNSISGEISALNDLVDFDQSDDSVSLWHCGVAAGCWANSKGITWDNHFNVGKGVVADLNYEPGEVTITSLDNQFDNLLIMTGTILDKEGFQGSGGWVNELAINGEKVGLEDIINTICVNRVNHHYVSARGNFRNELMEFSGWLGLNVLRPVFYEPFIQLPNAQEVRSLCQ
jgi:L-fucose isomerase-like protein